ncbi:MAG: lysine--tRNA ligase [Fibrobacterota bacterium]
MSEISDQMKARMEKRQKLMDMGINPYPYTYERTHLAGDVIENFTDLEKNGTVVRICGRLMAYRRMGKTAFADIKDPSGRIQAVVARDIVGTKEYEMFKLLDLGDFVGIEGPLLVTRTGEKSVKVEKGVLLSKSLRPLPVPKEKKGPDGERIVFDQFKDKETRYRQRYADLALNDEVMEVFKKRSAIISVIRKYLAGEGFTEVETPTLQGVYGGASARPFVTHHNALDIDLYLRISNELYLKRCVAGGMEKVFEFVKDFRNEGIDRTHNPEFTQLEFYEAYADYNKMMERFENIFSMAAQEVLGTTVLEYDGKKIDLSPPWKRMTMADAISEFAGLDIGKMSDDRIKTELDKIGVKQEGVFMRGMAIATLFEELCEDKLIQPVFITDHPRETSPLCKVHREDDTLIERFEPYINGWEIGNAYSELNDPVIQKKCLEDQVERGRGGEDETHPMDNDFIRCMEYGMPPMGGTGIGIDRMVMLFTNSDTIRDVILFPLLKGEN